MKQVLRVLGLFSAPGIKFTEQVIAVLWMLGGAMLASILVFGIFRGISFRSVEMGASFVFWGGAIAFAALLSGGLFGLLFGLPTSRRVEVQQSGSGGGGSGDASEPATGYVESTSLEQIADFIVKGLVAISLTRFDDWVGRFDILAANTTGTLMGGRSACAAPGPCSLDRVPGGMLLAGFALLGFLIAYLWMRRWFIGEMVQARVDERFIMRKEREEIERARANGLLGAGASRSNDRARMVDQAEAVARNAVGSVADEAKSQAEAITGKAADSDDPWKGQFGGAPAARGCALLANVSPLLTDRDFFQVDLVAQVSDEELRRRLIGTNALFYLHPTFGDRPREVTVGVDGKASLQLFSYGAFTVGVLLADGTRLELDLAELPGAPQKFIER